MSSIEQTLSIIKPDAVERKLTEKIKRKFLDNKLTIKNKKIQISKEEAAEFYKFIKQNLFTIDYADICLQDR